MRIFLISTLYPNSKQPTRALYNKRHFEALKTIGHEVEVIAPVPWYPGKTNLPPVCEFVGKILVHHPRFFYTPGVMIDQHWRSYRFFVKNILERVIKDARCKMEDGKMKTSNFQNNVHIILGFVYPDAVAMASICRNLGLHYSVLVLGSDFRVRTKQKRFANKVMMCLQEAPSIFCPGKALKNDMSAAGINEEKIFAFNNGTNKKVFFYNEEKIQTTPYSHQTILFVGNLVDIKAPERLLRAFAKFQTNNAPTAKVLIVGFGPLKERMIRLCEKLSIHDLVEFLGRQPPNEIARRMKHADTLCLCSKSEGMPNVVIEALSCGCPVVATAVGEIPHLIDEGVNGYTVPVEGQTEDQIISCLSVKLHECTKNNWNRKQIAEAMNSYSWENAAQEVTKRLM